MHHWITSTQSVTYHACHDLSPVLWLLLLRRQGADLCGKGDNGNPGRDKVPLETIEGATCGKVYLRDDSCLFNVSSFLDLYANNLKWLHSSSGKVLKVIISLGNLSFKSSISLYMVLTLATSTPETEEHIKLIDRLSE